jgi:hypothetical protein
MPQTRSSSGSKELSQSSSPQQEVVLQQSTTGAKKLKSFFDTFIPLLLLFGLLPNLVVLIKNGPVDGLPGDDGKGHWGDKTANVNWCEADYAITIYVAEWWNTLSSFTMIFYGLFGLCKHRKTVEPQYSLAFLVFMVVGFGSAGFHATLWRGMQLADELPMVWGNSVFIFILMTVEDQRGRGRRFEGMVLGVVTIVMTVAIILFDSEGQEIFLLIYGSGVLYLSYKSREIDLKYNGIKTVALMEVAMLFYAVGFVLVSFG